jgi:putative endonuclease
MDKKILNKKAKELGIKGENLAVSHLIKSGYLILKRNERIGFDEIDIIALGSDKTLVFIEVKTAMIKEVGHLFMPEDQMSGRKMDRIARACQKFSVAHPELINDDHGWRIDLIAIAFRNENELISLHHYENI